MVRNRVFFSRVFTAAAIGLLAVGILTGCGGGEAGGSPATRIPTRTYTPKNGDTVPAEVGKRFVVKLTSNPTTGYQWSVKDTAPVVRFISSSYQAPAGGGVGAPGEQVLTFEGVKDGTGDVALAYERPFAPGEPGKSLTFSVDVSS